MAHTQRNPPRTPSAASGGSHKDQGQPAGQNDPDRGQKNKVSNSPRKRAPQAAAGKRQE